MTDAFFIEGVASVGQTSIVREASKRGQALAVHGWIYRLQDGLPRDLNAASPVYPMPISGNVYAPTSMTRSTNNSRLSPPGC